MRWLALEMEWEDIMDFSVGDKVLYASRGAGTIIALEHQELVDGFEDYYVIEMRSQRLTLRIPVRMMGELGVRQVMRRDELSIVWETLKGIPQSLPDDFKERQEQIKQRLRTGRPLDIVEAVRDLSWRELQAYLTKADSRLLARSRELLADELALVLDKENAEVEQMLDEALAVHAADESGDE